MQHKNSVTNVTLFLQFINVMKGVKKVGKIMIWGKVFTFSVE